jgi:glycosyltransferase involved in cell wall biosynthesis
MNKNKDQLHVLYISTGFPNYFNKLDGIFYLDQAIALKKYHPNSKVGFISVNPIGLRDFIKKPNIFKLGMNSFDQFGVQIIHYCYINIPFISNFDIKIGKLIFPKLFVKYITKYGQPQIIHLHAYEAGLATINIKEKYKIPYIITEHSSKFINNKLTDTQESIAYQVFKNSSLNIAVSSYFAKNLNSKFKVPFITIANLVKMNEFNNKEIIPKKYQIISIGTFNQNKNQILLLETLKKYKFGKVLLVGEGPNEFQLKNFVKEFQLTELVEFLPFQPREKLFKLIKQSVCLAITSNHETFGVVAIEALACGIPVISTKAGGPDDIIVNEINGYIIENNVDSFYEAFCKVSKKLSKFAPSTFIDYAMQNFSEKAISEKLFNTYMNIIKSNG